MFSCTCCEVPRSFSVRKSLYRHQRNTGTYEDPRAKDARERREAYARAPKSCEACGIEFSYEDVVTGSKVKYCSRSCAVSVNNLIPKRRRETPHSKDCIVCGKTRGRNAGLFCSNACQSRHQFITETVPRILRGEVNNRPTLKKYLAEMRGWKCEICARKTWRGQTIKLELDHINGDPSNDLPENLRIICPNCHSMLPTSKGGNRGNGRKSRGLRL